MRYLTTYEKGNKNLLKIAMDDGTEKWVTTTSAVLAYVKKNFTKGEEAKFEMVKKNGQYHVTKILKVDKNSSKTEIPKPEISKSASAGYQKSPEDKEQIKRLSILSSASNAVATTMQGQVGDVNTLVDMIITVYERLYKKISE